jgi:hypothetical protein
VINPVLHGVRFAADRSLHFALGSPELLVAKANPSWHVIATVSSEATGAATRFALNLRAIGYVPTVAFLSLVFAGALVNRGALRSTLLGFVLVQAYFVFSAALPVALFLSNERVQALDLGPTVSSLLDMLFQGLVVPPAMSYAVPALIWLMVTFVFGASVAEYRARAVRQRSKAYPTETFAKTPRS